MSLELQQIIMHPIITVLEKQYLDPEHGVAIDSCLYFKHMLYKGYCIMFKSNHREFALIHYNKSYIFTYIYRGKQ